MLLSRGVGFQADRQRLVTFDEDRPGLYAALAQPAFLEAMRMVRSTRRVWAAVGTALVFYCGAFSTAALQGRAQAPGPPPTAAQLPPFAPACVSTVAMGST